MALEPSKHVNGRMWSPGVSGNPNGRPVGSRTVFSQSFLKRPSLSLGRAWSRRHGKDGDRSARRLAIAVVMASASLRSAGCK